jgi:aromatic-L-amino-acid/L-tryptophan decarboxylase
VRGRYAIRAAIVNHRSRREDFDALVDAVERIGREVAAAGGGGIGG